jgi:hypothetical protein
METTTETNQNHRELTKTEIKITLAQIEDRLNRAIKAADFCRHHDLESPDFESDEDRDAYYNEGARQVEDKYEIPYGVSLMVSEAMTVTDIPQFLKFAKWWVQGEMTEEIFDLFCFHYGEVTEVDYFWVLMDQPGFYYLSDWPDHTNEPTHIELKPELKQIGTRSKKKARMNFKMNFGHC